MNYEEFVVYIRSHGENLFEYMRDFYSRMRYRC